MRQSVRLTVLALGLLAGSGLAVTASADEIAMPQAAASIADTAPPPPRGQTMARVRERLGEPSSRRGPVGQPPITRWNYPGMIVVFEHDRVISTVIPGAPPPLYHAEELRARN